jgi:hypothetical protein
LRFASLQYYILSFNLITDKLDASVPVGTIAFFARRTAPTGWLKANGEEVSRTTYALLFAAIGTNFGGGNGYTTFHLPDLRGEFIRGWSDGSKVDKGRIFGSFQWGSSIPMVGYLKKSGDQIAYPSFAIASGFQDRLLFAGTTFDEGFETNVQSGQTRSGITLPNFDDYKSSFDCTLASSDCKVSSWNIFKGTRPRNIALLACIKY